MIFMQSLSLILSFLPLLSYSFQCIVYHHHCHGHNMRTPCSATADILTDRFSRWRFLQQVLDGESDEHQTNLILGRVIRNYVSSSVDAAAPEHTNERLSAVQAVIDTALPDGSIPVLPNCDFSLLNLLKCTLPDPNNEEDAYKSNWDMVLEIHGRESVKLNEQAGEASWKTSSLIARVLLFYDFLTSD